MKLLLFLIMFSSLKSFAFGIGETNLVWENAKTTVCWGEKEDITKDIQDLSEYVYELFEAWNIKYFISSDKKYKKRVQKLVTQHFKKSITGFEFVGWKDCRDTEEPQVIILPISYSLSIFLDKKQKLYYEHFKGIDGKSSIGDSAINEQGSFFGEPLYIKNNNKRYLIIKKEAEDTSILHEFGHSAGLRHENIKKEASFDKICSFFGMTDSDEGITNHTHSFSIFDQYSIMNSCHLAAIDSYNILDELEGPGYLDENIKFLVESRYKDSEYMTNDSYMRVLLSMNDIHSLRCLYVYDKSIRDEICHENFDAEKNSGYKGLYKHYLNSLN